MGTGAPYRVGVGLEMSTHLTRHSLAREVTGSHHKVPHFELGRPPLVSSP